MIYYPVFGGVDYREGLLSGTTKKRRADVYYPGNVFPAAPLRTLFWGNNLGLTTSVRNGSIEDAVNYQLRYQALEAGYAVIDYEMTVTDVGGEPTGGGMYREPTDPEYDPDGGGDDTPQLDVIWLVQFFRYYAAQYGLDPSRFALAGSSGASLVSMFAALGPDHADPTNPVPWRRVSSRPQAMIDYRIGGWFKGVVQDLAAGGAQVDPAFLRKLADDTAKAADCEEADPNHVLHCCPGWYMVQPGAAELNRRLPVYTWTNDEESPSFPAIGAVTYALNADLTPAMTGTATDGLVDRHGPFGGRMRIKALRALDSWHDTHSRLVAEATYGDGEIAADAVFATIDLAAPDTLEWLDQEMPANGPNPGSGGGQGQGMPVSGNNWFTVASEGNVWPSDGEGASTDDRLASILPENATVVVESILIETLEGEDPSVTLVSGTNLDVLTFHLPAESTGRADEFLEVQRGEKDYGAAADTDTSTINAVDTAKAFARLTNSRFSNAGRSTPDTTGLNNDDLGETCTLTAATTVTYARYASGDNADHRLAFEVLEYVGAGSGDPNEFIVRSVAEYTLADTSATQTSAAISSIVDHTKCVAFLLGSRNAFIGATWEHVSMKLEITASKELVLTRGGSSGQWRGHVAVVEFTGANWTVRTFSDTMTTTNAREAATMSGSIPSWDNAFIIGTCSVPATATAVRNSGLLYLKPTSGTSTVECVLPASATTGQIISGWVVYNPDINCVHYNSFDGGIDPILGATQVIDYTIPAVDTERTFVVGYAVTTGATATTYPTCNINYRLQDSTTVEFWRGLSSSLAGAAAFTTVETAAPGLEYPVRAVGRLYKFGALTMRGLGARTNSASTKVKINYRRVG